GVVPGEDDDQGEGDQQGGHVDLVGVEDGDDQQRAQVVDDRQRGEEDAKGKRDAAAEDRQNAKGEGDVGGHRDAPAAEGGLTEVEQGVDGAGDDHAADGRDDGDGGPLRRGEFADEHLALDLQADDEEEDGHQ